MVQARILHPNIQLVDITKQFHQSASSIPQGQLVKDEHFTLFEAVGALEIGDRKMDSGCLEEGEDLEDDFDFSKTLSAGQVVWLMDELMCREVAWHKGYPLSQTLFTSIHIERLLWPEPKQLADAQFVRSPQDGNQHLLDEMFRVYCLGLIKCCDLVHTLVTSQHYYEEEDFATQLFNRELLHTFHPEGILAQMSHAIEGLEAPSDAGDDTRVRNALLERLKLRVALLKTFMCCLDSMDPSSEISTILASIESVDASSGFAEPLPEAFSIKIQRRLASSVPPRPMIVVGRTESTAFFQQLLANIGSAFQMFKVSHSFDVFTAYWTFMNQKPEPSVYVRALLQSFLSIDDHVLGKQTTKDFVIADLKSMVLPASLLLDPANEVVENPIDNRFRIASQMTQFIHKVSPSFVNQYRSLCQNRCRLRRLLCHAAIELDNIQADAEDLDGFFQTLVNEKPLLYPAGEAPTYAYPLSSWIYHYKLIQLQLVVHMGFELSVYATYEFAAMYWYLSHLTTLHLSHLERISYFVSSKSQSRAGQSREMQTKETQDALSLLYRQFSRLKATDTLASALHRLYIILQRHGHCNKVSPAYATDELRFDLRMRPFQSLSIPEPLKFQEMESLTKLGSLADKEILDQAARLALTSRKAWEEVLKHDWNFNPNQSVASAVGSGQKHDSMIEREWKNEVRNSIKACIGTSIAITLVSKALNESSKDKQSLKDLRVRIPGPEDADRFHRWWAVPKISRR